MKGALLTWFDLQEEIDCCVKHKQDVKDEHENSADSLNVHSLGDPRSPETIDRYTKPPKISVKPSPLTD
ncbi:unnamed protein product [Heterobilharzia americana]|nr:unnamed protein product [Heterobilharzia americana]